MRALAAIRAGFPRLTALAEKTNLAAPAVSRWSVGEHLDHVVKVHAGILAYFAEPPVGDTSVSGISLVGRIVLFTGHIPRGRGKSPERFLPVQVEVTHLQVGLAAVAEGFSRLNEQMSALHDSTTRFAHPAFGGLTRRQWLRFAEVHQLHHVAIIDDIVRASATIGEDSQLERAGAGEVIGHRPRSAVGVAGHQAVRRTPFADRSTHVHCTGRCVAKYLVISR